MSIVKVQQSLNDGGKQVLVYSQDHSIFAQLPCDSEIREALAGRVKAYFLASRGEDGALDLWGEVAEQQW